MRIPASNHSQVLTLLVDHLTQQAYPADHGASNQPNHHAKAFHQLCEIHL